MPKVIKGCRLCSYKCETRERTRMYVTEVETRKKDARCALLCLLVRSPGLALQRLLAKPWRGPHKIMVLWGMVACSGCPSGQGKALRLFFKQAVQVRGQEKTPFPVFWCGHRDLNPDVIDIRPSNVRVCQFRHDRISSIVIIWFYLLIVKNFAQQSVKSFYFFNWATNFGGKA